VRTQEVQLEGVVHPSEMSPFVRPLVSFTIGSGGL
jgi:hypothetical protein